MKIYYSAQIVERGRDLPLQLVSLGMVRDDGAELYVINEENLSGVMQNRRLGLNAVPLLPIKVDPSPTLSMIFSWDPQHEEYGYVLPLTRLIEQVRTFIGEAGPAELWSHYAAYNHVVLAQLFGPLGELPAGFPMLTKDIAQLADEHPHVVLPAVPDGTHHALVDARWVQAAHDALLLGRKRDEMWEYQAPAIGQQSTGALLAEVLDLAEREVNTRLSGEDLHERLEQTKRAAEPGHGETQAAP